jgi:hypothetical protein
MTRDYLIGELSARLEQLQAATRHPAATGEVANLRRQVETRSATWLGTEVTQALALADHLCWESLSQGDTAAFDRQAAIGAGLRLFGTCARLIDDDLQVTDGRGRLDCKNSRGQQGRAGS